MRYALLGAVPGTVLNVVEAPADWKAPDGLVAVASDGAAKDDTYDGKVFTAPPETLPTETQLAALAQRKRDSLLGGGITVNLAATGAAPRLFSVDTTGDGRANILGLQKLDDLGHPISWVQSTGTIALTRSDLDALGVAAGLFVGECYATWGDCLAAIKAGTMTTLEAVAAASWPATQIAQPPTS